MPTKKSANNNSENKNIRIPDVISNINTKKNNYSMLDNEDDSDYEIDTRKSNYSGQNSNSKNISNSGHSIQMQHEVNNIQ